MANRIVSTLTLALLVAAPALAHAASSDVNVSASNMGFSSPNSNYGPWDWATVSLRTHANSGDTYQLSFSSRSDRDLTVHTNGNYVEALVVHNWSNHLYSDFSAGVGSGAVFAKNAFSGDINLRGQSMIWTLGTTHVKYQSGTGSTSLRLGPTFYQQHLAVSLLATEVMNTGNPSGMGGVADIMFLEHGRESANLAVSYQRSQYDALVAGLPPAQANVTSYEARLSKSFVITQDNVLKAEVAALKLNNLQTGRQEFFGRGLTLSFDHKF